MESSGDDRPVGLVTREQLDQAIKVVNNFVDQVSPGLEFSVDTYTNLVVVKVVDPETNKVLRQFPSEEVLQIASAIDNMKGLLIHQKV